MKDFVSKQKDREGLRRTPNVLLWPVYAWEHISLQSRACTIDTQKKVRPTPKQEKLE